MKRIALAILALAATLTYAQTPAPTLTFTPGSEVVAFKTNVAGVPQWSVGNLTTESFDLIDFGKTKAQHFSIVGTELLAPTPGISMYHAGGSYVPNVTCLFSKTNIPSNTISFHVDGSIGIAIPGSGNEPYFVDGRRRIQAIPRRGSDLQRPTGPMREDGRTNILRSIYRHLESVWSLMSTQVTIVDADLAALVNEMRATLRKIDAVADAVLAAIPVIQSKAAQAADAMTSAQSSLDTALGDIRKNAADITEKVVNLKLSNVL